MIQIYLRIKFLLERIFLFQVSFFFHIMSVLHTIEELEQLRAVSRKALHDDTLCQKEGDFNQAIEKLRKEKDSLESHKRKNDFFRKILYPDMVFINVDLDLRKSLAVLYYQIDSKTAEIATILQYKKDLRSSIGLYSQQIEHLKSQHKQKEKAELTSLKKELKSRKKELCHRSNSVHPLSHNPYFALLCTYL